MEHSGPPAHQGRRVSFRGETLAGRLHPDQLDVAVGEKAREDTHGVRAAADAGDHRPRQPPAALQHLPSALAPDHGLKVPHDARERVGSHDRADDVVRGRHVGHPVAQRFVGRILERARARGHRHDAGAHQLHAVDVEPLAPHVLLTHVHHALQPEARAHRRRGDTVLTRARLGDDAALPHAPRQQRLPQRVVDLVGAGVVQILAFQQHAHARADLRRESRHVRQRRGTPHVIAEEGLQLRREPRIALRLGVHTRQVLERRHQRLGDVAAAVRSETAGLYRRRGHGSPRICLRASPLSGLRKAPAPPPPDQRRGLRTFPPARDPRPLPPFA